MNSGLNLSIPSYENNSDLIFYKVFSSNVKENECEFEFVFLHDIGTYHRPYFKFMEELEKTYSGRSIYTFIDFYGHGNSGGERCASISSKSYLRDIYEVLSATKRDFSAKKTILIGHGFGGTICLLGAAEKTFTNVSGYLLINPILKFQLSTYLDKIIKKDIIIGNGFRVNSSINGLSRYSNIDLAVEHDSDPLNLNFFTRGFLKNVRKTAKEVRSKAYYIDQPLHFIVNDHQQILDTSIVGLFSRGVSSKNIEVQKFKGTKQNFFLEDNRNKLLDELSLWIDNL